MALRIAVDKTGNSVLLVVDVGPKVNGPDAEHFFAVHFIDVDGDIPSGIKDSLFGPLPKARAIEIAEKYAEDNGLRLSE
jgi:hypothetical protein